MGERGIRWPDSPEQAPDKQQTTDEVAASLVPFLVRGCSEDAIDFAAQQLVDGFEAWDRQERLERFRVFAGEVQEKWQMEDTEEEDCLIDEATIVVENIAEVVTAEMLEGTFEQIGRVKDVQMEECFSLVEFFEAGDAEDAVLRFSGVELAGQPMMIRMCMPGQE